MSYDKRVPKSLVINKTQIIQFNRMLKTLAIFARETPNLKELAAEDMTGLTYLEKLEIYHERFITQSEAVIKRINHLDFGS